MQTDTLTLMYYMNLKRHDNIPTYNIIVVNS